MRHITYHAVEQFIRRWEPTKNYEEAKEELDTLFRHATNSGKTPLGDTIMASAYRPEVRFVVKDRNVCVTILPPGNLEDATEIYEEELLELQASKQFKLKCMTDELEELEKQKVIVHEERVKLGLRKNSIDNKISALKKNIEACKEF